MSGSAGSGVGPTVGVGCGPRPHSAPVSTTSPTVGSLHPVKADARQPIAVPLLSALQLNAAPLVETGPVSRPAVSDAFITVAVAIPVVAGSVTLSASDVVGSSSVQNAPSGPKDG